MRAVIVIPARLGSTRLPGKALLSETGRPVLQHVFEGCTGVRGAPRVIIATDDARIAECASSFGAEVRMTSPHHPSGSDRVAEVAAALTEDVIINVQGDEVEIRSQELESLLVALEEDEEASIATLAVPIKDEETWRNPNVVKVVVDARGRAMYFSRSPIPHGAGRRFAPGSSEDAFEPLKHRGVYAFRREALLRWARLEPVPLERAEKLEQLRALHHSLKIQVVSTPHDGIEVNTREDYDRFVARQRFSRGSG